MKKNITIECIEKDSVLSNNEILSALIQSTNIKNIDRNKKNILIEKLIKQEDIDLSKNEKEVIDTFLASNERVDNHSEFSFMGLMGIIFSSLSFIIVVGLFIYLIFTGETRATLDFNMSLSMVFMISIFIIILLAFLEGSQLAIVNLSMKDLSNSMQYPIAYEIQKLTKTKEKTQDYLIGRQLLVVVIVTIFSILTSFPNISSINSLPLSPIFTTIIFKLGLLNALILLWFGQLIPQLFATKSPQTILNFRVMKYVVYLCLLLSKLRIAKPVSLIVQNIKTKEVMPPISQYDAFIQDSDKYQHFYNIKAIEIKYSSFNEVLITSNDSIILYEGVKKIFWHSIGIDGHIDTYTIDNITLTSIYDKTKKIDADVDESFFEAYDKNGVVNYTVALRPVLNSFEEKDVINIPNEYSISNLQKLDIHIDKPTRVFFIKISIPIELKKENIHKRLLLNHYTYNQVSEEYEIIEQICSIEEEVDSYSVKKYAIMYPSLSSLFTLSWEV